MKVCPFNGGLLKFSDLSQFIAAVTRFLVKTSVKINVDCFNNTTKRFSSL